MKHMKSMIKNNRSVLYTLSGVLLGLGISFVSGRSGGIGAITSDPAGAMFYMGLAGWLFSLTTKREQ